MILLGDAAKVLQGFNDECIDLTVTSPPYDNLRTYNGFIFDFEKIAIELYRVTKQGGIVVWVVGDATIEGDESGTSFRQALYFKQIGFKLYDTMIYAKTGFNKPYPDHYHQGFEYMFILSKGKLKTFKPLMDRINKYPKQNTRGTRIREADGTLTERRVNNLRLYGKRYNVWLIPNGFNISTKDEIAFNHPAIFPDKLAADHIKSWSNEGDIVLDPFLGSGTTYKMAYLLRRKPVGIEINPEYIKLAKQRLMPYLQQQRLTQFT